MKEFSKEINNTENLVINHAVKAENAASQGMRAVSAECLKNGCLATMDAWLEQIEA